MNCGSSAVQQTRSTQIESPESLTSSPLPAVVAAKPVALEPTRAEQPQREAALASALAGAVMSRPEKMEEIDKPKAETVVLQPAPVQQREATPPPEPIPAPVIEEEPNQSHALRWTLVFAALILVAAAGAGSWAWMRHARQGSTPVGANHANSSDPGNASPMPVAATPKPSPEAPTAAPSPSLSPTPSISQPSSPTSHPSAQPLRVAPGQRATQLVPTPKPEPQKMPANVASEPTPPSLAPKPSTNSGVLHYGGPPVHFGEIVNFTHLPGGRLRFTFDHQAWQPLISRQSDGTQTLTLRSLKHTDQTECEVHWEIAP